MILNGLYYNPKGTLPFSQAWSCWGLYTTTGCPCFWWRSRICNLGWEPIFRRVGLFCRGRKPPSWLCSFRMPGCVRFGVPTSNSYLLFFSFFLIQGAFFCVFQSGKEWTAAVILEDMSKPVTTFVCKVLWNGLLRYILWNMSKPVITFVFKVLRNGLLHVVHAFTHVQTCDNVRVQSATEWTCFGTYFSTCPNRPVITVVFKVLRNGLLRYIL